MINFIRESNLIEGIDRDPTPEEIAEFYRFMDLEVVTVADLEQFVSVYQPDARLRRAGQPNVWIGGVKAPESSDLIEINLQHIIGDLGHYDPWQTHVLYEHLHPFTDGNGRSGRMLWAWQMGADNIEYGFLHHFIHQSANDANFEALRQMYYTTLRYTR